MKKFIALLSAALLVLSFASCSVHVNINDNTAGAYTASDSITLTDSLKEKFAAAAKSDTSSTFEAIAYLGSQVVSGTNYKFVAKVTPTDKDAAVYYATLIVYEDTKGIIYLNEVNSILFETDGIGSWLFEADTEAPADVTSYLAEQGYSVSAILATQIVSGTNYALICKSDDGYCLVYVNVDTDSNVKVTNSVEL